MVQQESKIHVEDVKASIRKRGSSLAEEARGLGVSVNAVSQVLRGKTTSARIEAQLAEASGYSIVQIRRLTRGLRQSWGRKENEGAA